MQAARGGASNTPPLPAPVSQRFERRRYSTVRLVVQLFLLRRAARCEPPLRLAAPWTPPLAAPAGHERQVEVMGTPRSGAAAVAPRVRSTIASCASIRRISSTSVDVVEMKPYRASNSVAGRGNRLLSGFRWPRRSPCESRRSHVGLGRGRVASARPAREGASSLARPRRKLGGLKLERAARLGNVPRSPGLCSRRSQTPA
jgi:hypothetical protein